VLTVEADPGPEAMYFYAHQFGLIDGTGGYLGIQTRGTIDDQTGHTAIFSIWDALGAQGRLAMRFGGEGEGWSCRLMYPWRVGDSYRLRLHSPTRGWWVAAITDESTAETTEIGRIQVPYRWQRLGDWSVMWTEWYGGPVKRCSDLPHSRVVFRTPAADDGLVAPTRTNDHLATGVSCRNSAVERLDDGSRQMVGITSPTPDERTGPLGWIAGLTGRRGRAGGA
jgi:Domain of unknown function (DUF3472)